MFLFSILVFYIFVASYLYFSNFVVEAVVFYLEKFEEIVFAAFDLCYSASFDKMLRDWHLGSFTVAVKTLNRHDPSLDLVYHHSNYFSVFIVFQDQPVVEFIFMENSCIISSQRFRIHKLGDLHLGWDLFYLLVMEFNSSADIVPFFPP